mgnify:CR=1 FL=1
MENLTCFKEWGWEVELKKKYMIRKISIITFLITIFSLFSCGQNNENLNHSTSEKKVQTSKTIIKKNLDNDLNSLDHFKGFPEEIVGCSCYFSETNTNFSSNAEYKIYDIFGKEVKKGILKESRQESVNLQLKGVFILNVSNISTKKIIHSQKIIIQ